MRKVLVIDTCGLCVWLEVAGMDSCGPDADRWDNARVNSKIDEELGVKTTFVLPLASIIETGNHIAQSIQFRMQRANALAVLILKSAYEETPWAAFSDQSLLWSSEKLKSLATTWPTLANQRLSLGDATIKDVAEYYAQMGCHVEILTGDQGLKAYEPIVPVSIPRRRIRR
jgi:hypothetical protein